MEINLRAQIEDVGTGWREMASRIDGLAEEHRSAFSDRVTAIVRDEISTIGQKDAASHLPNIVSALSRSWRECIVPHSRRLSEIDRVVREASNEYNTIHGDRAHARDVVAFVRSSQWRERLAEFNKREQGLRELERLQRELVQNGEWSWSSGFSFHNICSGK